jgi:hypothetical protein
MHTELATVPISLYHVTRANRVIARVRPHTEFYFMAVWQFRLGLIPRQPLIDRFGEIPESRTNTDEWAWLWDTQPPEDYHCMIESFTVPYKSWTPDIMMWGSENGNRLHVVMEAGRVVEVNARLCPGEKWIDFAEGIILLAKHCDWVLSLNDGKLFLPDFSVLTLAVLESNAMKFCKDPLEFLGGIGSGKYRPE